MRAYVNRDLDLNASNENLANSNPNGRMTWLAGTYSMKTHNNLYSKIISYENLFIAYRKARKNKTKKEYVIEFEINLEENLMRLHEELKNEIYFPKPLVTFILRDPKTRKISKSDFRDRIVHHAIVNILEPIYEKIFIYDSCANRKGKGNSFTLKRFDLYQRKVSNNLHCKAFCLKADVKHYFLEVNHKILLRILKRKIKDEKVTRLVGKILENGGGANRNWNATWQFNKPIFC